MKNKRFSKKYIKGQKQQKSKLDLQEVHHLKSIADFWIASDCCRSLRFHYWMRMKPGPQEEE
jgi:hypothetical protein